MGGKNSKPKSLTASNAGAGIPSTNVSTRRRMAQDYLLVWVDGNIDETNEDCQNTLALLRSVVNDVTLYTRPDECIQFLQEVSDEKVFVITSESHGQQLVADIHDMPEVDAIYILCGNKARHEQWTKTWVKIKGVHTDIKDICDALQVAVKQCNQDSIAISFVSREEGTSGTNLNQLEPTFMYTQIFKEILLEMKHEQQAVRDLAKYCRQLYDGNKGQLNIIDEFDRDYQPQSAIWWYTRQCFTYQMLNRALRTLDGNVIINMGFFIHDLHQQIQALHQQQLGSYKGKPFTVYRGQGLSKTDFDKLSKTQGGLMSFNNFLSTSKERNVSLRFASRALNSADMVGILFVMFIDPRVLSTPFSNIREVSYFKKEEEILFSMHAVFRVGAIQQIDKNNQLYQVDLRLTADDDEELRVLAESIGEEAAGDTGWKRLGNLLLTIGQFDKAGELYNVLLEQTPTESDKGHYYHKLGRVKYYQGDHQIAVDYYNKALEIQEKTLHSTHPDLATSSSNIGSVHYNMGEYSKAHSFYNKALEIQEKTLSPTHPSLAVSYSDIGGVYGNMEEYPKALSFYNKALEIAEKTLPPTHPLFAIYYNNIGVMYGNMEEYPKALSFYDKALEIAEKALPPTHPSFAIYYNNIGVMYGNMEEYPKALSFYNKALDIQKKALPPTHPSLATSYNNIGGVYMNETEHSKALSFLEKALEIEEKALPPTHPSLAVSYSDIGMVYKKMGEYPKALSFYNKALIIEEKALPPTHSDLAISYNNIGGVYKKMGEYSTALSFYNKALEIREKTLSPTHRSLATSYNNIGSVYDSMGEHSKALSYFKRAQDIWQRVLPADHPHLKNVETSIETVKEKLRVR